MKAKFLCAVALQAIGPLVLLLLSTAIARGWGAEQQGAFVAAKSLVDLLVAIGSFGFPQSVLIAINRHDASRRWLYFATVFYALILFPVFTTSLTLTAAEASPTLIMSAYFSLAVSLIVLTNIVRAISLTVEEGVGFHIITIAPSICLSAITAISLIMGVKLSADMHYIYAASGICAVTVALLLFPPSKVRSLSGKKPDVKALATNGLDVFVQGVSLTSQTFLCINWLQNHVSLEAVGHFGISLLIANSLIFPMQAISPMILNRWSKVDSSAALYRGRRETNIALVFLSCLVAIAVVLCPSVGVWILGSDYAEAGSIMQVMIVSILPTFIFRLDTLRLAAVGEFRTNSIVSAIKCIVVYMLLSMISEIYLPKEPALLVALVWLSGEIGAMLMAKSRIKVLMSRERFS